MVDDRMDLKTYTIRKAGTRGAIITIPETFMKVEGLKPGDRLKATLEEEGDKVRLVYEKADDA